jgi:hypothetical protein
MAAIDVREARLDDTQSISDLFRTRITVWQRLNAGGQVEDVSYDALTIYERWLHGGPWMSVETAAIHLSHLLGGAGIPLVAGVGGSILAYAESYHGIEPEPFANHLHLAQLVIDPAQDTETFQAALLTAVIERARSRRCARITANCVANDADTQNLYTQYGMTPIAKVKRYSLSAKSGQGFYKVVDHLNDDSQQIERWFLSVGRFGSSREEWENLWPRTFDAISEIRERHTRRLLFSAAGQEALVCCQPQLYAPRNAEIYLWSPKPLTTQLLTALRDWTYREGFRSLVMAVTEDSAIVLGSDAEPDGFYLDVFGVKV